MKKETKFMMFKNLQGGRGTEHKTTLTSRNQNGTYQPALTTQQGGEAMELNVLGVTYAVTYRSRLDLL